MMSGLESTAPQQPADESAAALLRVTIVNNRNQKQRTTVVLRSEDLSRSTLLQAARNKLRLSKARRVFLSVPGEQRRDGNVVYELFDTSALHHGNDQRSSRKTASTGTTAPDASPSSSLGKAEDKTEDDLRMLRTTLCAKKDRALVLVSCGEDYVGKEAVAAVGGPMSTAGDDDPQASVLILADRSVAA